MNDLEIIKNLKIAITKPEPIKELIIVVKKIITEILSSHPERMRFWLKKIKSIHNLINEYINQYKLIESDIIGHNYIDINVDTNNTDMKYWFLKGGSRAPYCIRNTVSLKMNDNQLEMIEDTYTNLNIEMSKALSHLFENKYNLKTWAIPRQLAHSYYNTPDESGVNVFYRLKDAILQQINKKYGNKQKLFNHFYPIKENIKIEDDYIGITVEGKNIVVDIAGNKIIKNPNKIDKTPLEPKL